jgi:putative FmdB family regulatory protein
MPVYDFYCENCKALHESCERVDAVQSECPQCSAKTQRVFTTDGLHLNKCEYTPPPLAKRKFGDSKKTMHKRYRWH